MTNTQIKNNIASHVINKTNAKSISNTEIGNDLLSIVDYVDQETTSTTGTITLSATPSELSYEINSCSFSGGIGYLPAVNKIGTEIYVIAVSNNIEIRANVANTSKMFSVFNTFIPSIILTTNQMYRFKYIGFGSGINGATDGYWKAEQI